MADQTKATRGKGRLPAWISVGNLMKLPATIGTLRAFLDSVNWNAAEQSVREELRHSIVIAGLPNTGKSSLFNALQSNRRSAVSPEPGSTRSLIEGTFGPFKLLDTPGHDADIQASAAKDASVVLFLLDGTRQVTQVDRDLFDRLRTLKRPVLVAMNKCDAVSGDVEQLAATMAARLGTDMAIPISARFSTNIASDLIPALIEASPDAALSLGHALPAYRRTAAERVIRNAALLSLAAGLEPIPLVDIPILLGNQIRMLLRLAAIYGEPVGSQHVVELLMTIAGGLLMRYAASEVAKAIPFGGDFVSGAIAGAGTWAIGMVALEYFESGKQLTPQQLRELFRRFYDRFRTAEQVGTPAAMPQAHEE